MLPGQLLDNGSVVLGDYTLTSDQYRDWMMPALYPVNSSNVILLILYCLVFILAAVSNMLVIIVIYRFQHLRRWVDIYNKQTILIQLISIDADGFDISSTSSTSFQLPSNMKLAVRRLRPIDVGEEMRWNRIAQSASIMSRSIFHLVGSQQP